MREEERERSQRTRRKEKRETGRDEEGNEDDERKTDLEHLQSLLISRFLLLQFGCSIQQRCSVLVESQGVVIVVSKLILEVISSFSLLLHD